MAASTAVIGIVALVSLLVLVSLLPVPLSPAATGTEATALGLLGILGFGLFAYVGWGVATLLHTESSLRRPRTGTTHSLVQWTAVLTVVLLVYTGLGPVVTPTLGDLAVAYDFVFLVVAAVPVVAIATRLRSSRSEGNSLAENVEVFREDLNRGRSPDSDGEDD